MTKPKFVAIALVLVCALGMASIARAGLTSAEWEQMDTYLDGSFDLLAGAEANHTVLAPAYDLNLAGFESQNLSALAWMVKLTINYTGKATDFGDGPNFEVLVIPNASEPVEHYAGNFTMRLNGSTNANYHLDFNSTTPTYYFHFNNTWRFGPRTENVTFGVYCELWGLEPASIGWPQIPFLGLEWVLLFAIVFVLLFAYVRHRGRD